MTIILVSFISPTELTYVFLDYSTSLFVRTLSGGLWCPIASMFLCCCALCRVALLAGFMRELECKSGEPTLMNLNTLCVSEVCCIHHVVLNTTPPCVIGSILQKALFDLWVHVLSPHHGVGPLGRGGRHLVTNGSRRFDECSFAEQSDVVYKWQRSLQASTCYLKKSKENISYQMYISRGKTRKWPVLNHFFFFLIQVNKQT